MAERSTLGAKDKAVRNGLLGPDMLTAEVHSYRNGGRRNSVTGTANTQTKPDKRSISRGML